MSSFIEQIESNKNTFFSFLHLVSQQNKKLLIVGDLFELLRNNHSIFNSEAQKELEAIISRIQELVFLDHSAYCDVREKIASSQFFCFNLEESAYEQIPLIDFLKIKEAFINQGNSSDILTINFEPFYKKFPSVKDIKNVGNGKSAGTITAALFLEEFVNDIPWAHIDIAGPAFPSETNNYSKTYMTGYGVRLMFDYLISLK